MLRCSVIGVLNTHYFTGRFRVLLGISFHSAPISLKQNYSHKVGIVDALLNDFYDFLSLSVLLASCSCWQNGHMERQMPTKWFENCRSIYNGCLVFQAWVKGPRPEGLGMLDDTLNTSQPQTYIHKCLSQSHRDALQFALRLRLWKCHIYPSHPSFDLQS